MNSHLLAFLMGIGPIALISNIILVTVYPVIWIKFVTFQYRDNYRDYLSSVLTIIWLLIAGVYITFLTDTLLKIRTLL